MTMTKKIIIAVTMTIAITMKGNIDNDIDYGYVRTMTLTLTRNMTTNCKLINNGNNNDNLSINGKIEIVFTKVYYKTEVRTWRFREALKKLMHNNANTAFIVICLRF